MEQPYFVPDTSRGAIPEVPIFGSPRVRSCSVELQKARCRAFLSGSPRMRVVSEYGLVKVLGNVTYDPYS